MRLRWIIPLLLPLLLVPLLTAIDLSAARYFYELGKNSGEGFYNPLLFKFLYDFGPWPGLFLFFVSIALWVASFFFPLLKGYRRAAAALFLGMAVGAGLFVHAIFKDHWGRPRPKQVVEFGGSQSFRPFYKPNFFAESEPAKSFPCGHCSTGFYFFSLAYILQRLGRRRLSQAVFFGALAWGGGIGMARMAQGGHFFSDVVISGVIMWLTALACDRLIYTAYGEEESFDERADKKTV